jgi:hypothetical protein
MVLKLKLLCVFCVKLKITTWVPKKEKKTGNKLKTELWFEYFLWDMVWIKDAMVIFCLQNAMVFFLTCKNKIY